MSSFDLPTPHLPQIKAKNDRPNNAQICLFSSPGFPVAVWDCDMHGAVSFLGAAEEVEDGS